MSFIVISAAFIKPGNESFPYIFCGFSFSSASGSSGLSLSSSSSSSISSIPISGGIVASGLATLPSFSVSSTTGISSVLASYTV